MPDTPSSNPLDQQNDPNVNPANLSEFPCEPKKETNCKRKQPPERGGKSDFSPRVAIK